jgi:hypothetical protein
MLGSALTGTRACSDAEMSSVHPGPPPLPWLISGAPATLSLPAGPASGSSAVSSRPLLSARTQDRLS